MIVSHSVFEAEQAKYRKIWADPDYRVVSFGEQMVGPFLSMTGAGPGTSIVDVGCGTGRAAKKFNDLLMNVAAVDATREALDADVSQIVDERQIRFVESCLWHNWQGQVGDVGYAYCCDVMEHIPTEFTMLVAAMCIAMSGRAFFHINFDQDVFGDRIGQRLHLTIQPFTWWRDRLAELGRLIDARDMLGRGIFLVEGRQP